MLSGVTGKITSQGRGMEQRREEAGKKRWNERGKQKWTESRKREKLNRSAGGRQGW